MSRSWFRASGSYGLIEHETLVFVVAGMVLPNSLGKTGFCEIIESSKQAAKERNSQYH